MSERCDCQRRDAKKEETDRYERARHIEILSTFGGEIAVSARKTQNRPAEINVFPHTLDETLENKGL